MKKKKGLLIGGGLLFLLAALYALVLVMNQKQAEEKTEEKVTLLSMERDEIVKISYTNKEGTYHFRNVNRNWISEEKPEEILVEKIEIVVAEEGGKAEIAKKDGATLQLEAKLTPDNPTNTKVNWKVSDDTIAAINDKGVLTLKEAAKVEDTIKVTATSDDGNATSEPLTVTVVADSTGGDEPGEDATITALKVTGEPTTLKYNAGDTLDLTGLTKKQLIVIILQKQLF